MKFQPKRVGRGALGAIGGVALVWAQTGATGAFADGPPGTPIAPGVYGGIIGLQVADSLGPRFPTVAASAQGSGSGTMQLSATDAVISGTFNWNTSFTTQAATRDATGQGVLQVSTAGTLSGAPSAVTFDGSSTLSGTIHIDEPGISVDQPINLVDPIPGSGSRVQILAANCDEVDGSFAPPLVQNATSNGVVVQSLTAQFAVFRNADRLPPALLTQVNALNQQALAFKPTAPGLSAPAFLQQVGMLIHSANLLYTRIYNLIGDAGCDASGTWGTFLLPTVQVLFGFGLGPGLLSPDQLHALVALGFESGYLNRQAVAAIVPNLEGLHVGADLSDPTNRLILDLDTLHQDLAAQIQQATGAPGGPDLAALREVYLTAQMVGFDDLIQQLGAYAAATPSAPSQALADQTAASIDLSPSRAPLLASLPEITLQTPSAGGGPRPTLSWSGVPGAATYIVTLYTPDGPADWAWQGSDTSADLGGGSGPLPPTAPGPKISGEMSWQVLAYAADGTLAAASDRVSIGT